MKKNILIATILIVIMFLNSSCLLTKIINDKNIKSIKVYSIIDQKLLVVISDKEQIQNLIESINNSNKELIKFPGHYRIEIEYYDTTDTMLVLINGENIKINGVSYKSKNNIGELLYNLIKL